MFSADTLFRIHRLRLPLLALLLIGLGLTTSCRAGLFDDDDVERSEKTSCDQLIPPITSGYGADGPYLAEEMTFRNPLWRRKKVSVFLPKGVEGKAPVIFFSHAFGATDWHKAYADLMPHMVSRGYVVVFSPYPKFRSDTDERYAVLWKGFEEAVLRYGDAMDLGRVGFVGHSFGAGATPAMAYKGIVERGWGQRAAFLYMMAPWYAYQISDSQMKAFPPHVVELMQIYDKDTTNDHRMAIDIYRSLGIPRDKRFFIKVMSADFGACKLVADHVVPATNPSLRLKQYAVFKPFDALSDYVFNGNEKGRQALLEMTRPPGPNDGFQPLRMLSDPVPEVSEKTFRFPWSDAKRNPRISKERW